MPFNVNQRILYRNTKWYQLEYKKLRTISLFLLLFLLSSCSSVKKTNESTIHNDRLSSNITVPSGFKPEEAFSIAIKLSQLEPVPIDIFEALMAHSLAKGFIPDDSSLESIKRRKKVDPTTAAENGYKVPANFTATEAKLLGSRLSWIKPRPNDLITSLHLYSANKGDAVAQIMIANEKYKKGQIEDAVYWWKTSAQSGNSEAAYQLASALLKEGRYDEAVKWSLEAVSGKHHAGLGILGKSYLASGDVAKATTTFERGVEKKECISMVELAKIKYENRVDFAEEELAALELIKSAWSMCAVSSLIDRNSELCRKAGKYCK